MWTAALRSCPKTTFDKCRQSRRLWGGMKNELPIKRLRGRLALAETTRICTRGFFRRSTPAETRPAWNRRQNHNYAVYGDTSQNIRVLIQKGDQSEPKRTTFSDVPQQPIWEIFYWERPPKKSCSKLLSNRIRFSKGCFETKIFPKWLFLCKQKGLRVNFFVTWQTFFVTFTAVLRLMLFSLRLFFDNNIVTDSRFKI